MPIPFFAQIPARAKEVVQEEIINFDSYTIEQNILGQPNGLTASSEHKRMMVRRYENGKAESFFIPDDNLTEKVVWKKSDQLLPGI